MMRPHIHGWALESLSRICEESRLVALGQSLDVARSADR